MAKDRARVVAWNLYAKRLERLVKRQHDRFIEGLDSERLYCETPTDGDVALVQDALACTAREAQLDIIMAALSPIRDACDAIDNSGSKSETVKQCRAAIERAYDELHALRRRVEESVSANAVPNPPDLPASVSAREKDTL